MAKNNTTRTFLIARFSAIGDVALTIPVLYSVCRRNPATKFVFLTRKNLESIFINTPENLTVEGVDLDSPAFKGIFGMRRLTSAMYRKYRFSGFIDLHDVIRTRLIALFCRTRRIKVFRIDKGRREKRALTKKGKKNLYPIKPQVERYAETFLKADIPVGDLKNFKGVFGGRNLAPAEMFSRITTPKPNGKRWIAVAPFAAHTGKIYPPALMKEVVDALAAEKNTRLFLLGGGDGEQKILEEWAEGHGNITSLAGKRLGFASEMALLNHCDAALTMDSANMHLASLAMTPTVSVWGATHPYLGFYGFGKGNLTVHLPMRCRPCSVFGNRQCRLSPSAKYPPCLSDLSPALILSTLRQLLRD